MFNLKPSEVRRVAAMPPLSFVLLKSMRWRARVSVLNLI